MGQMENNVEFIKTMYIWIIGHWGETQSPKECINIGSDAIEITLSMFRLDESYAYIVETGQILFAGKNTPYYGHRNISELN